MKNNMRKSITLSLGTLVLLCGFVVSGYSQTFLTNGLVAYYPFNGDANDASGNGNDGIVVHPGTFISDRFGVSQGAVQFADFPAGPSHIETPQSQENPQIFSMCLWFRPDGSAGQLLHLSNTDRQIGTDAAGNLHFFLYPGYGVYLMSPTPVTGPRWHAVVATLSSAGMKLYLDGACIATKANFTSAQYAISHWAMANGTAVLDDVRIYNRALSAAEVRQLYLYEAGPQVDLIKAVKPSFRNLTLSTNYQLQVSSDMNHWTNEGTPFTATSTTMIYPQYWDVENWNSLFFRLQMTP